MGDRGGKGGRQRLKPHVGRGGKEIFDLIP